MKKILFIAMMTIAIASCGDNTTDTVSTGADSPGVSTESTDTSLTGDAPSPSATSTGVANGVSPTTGAGADSIDMTTSKGTTTNTGTSTQKGSKTDTTHHH